MILAQSVPMQVTHPIVTQLHTQWASVFFPMKAQELASIYATDAILLGSTIRPYIGRRAIQTYFEQLPQGVYIGVQFIPENTVELGSQVISMVGTVIFTRHQQAPLELRLTHIFVLEDHVWRIASHHVSPKLAL